MEPLQYYVCRLAEYCKVPDNKMLSLQILVEEVITHIIKKACNGKKADDLGNDQNSLVHFAAPFR